MNFISALHDFFQIKKLQKVKKIKLLKLSNTGNKPKNKQITYKLITNLFACSAV